MNADRLIALADALSDDFTRARADSVPADDVAGPAGLGEFLAGARPVDDDREVLAVAAALLRLRNVVDHGLACALAAAERMSIPARKRVRSGAALLMGLGAAPAVALRTACLGSAVDRIDVVARGMRDGALSAEFGDAVVKGLAYVDARVDGMPDADLAKVTASLMVQTTPAQVAAKAREWAIVLAPDAPDEAVRVAENPELNEMSLVQNEQGRVEATLDLDVVAGEELFSALDPLCRPVPEADGTADRRSVARRRADALGLVVRTYLSGSNRPESGGVLPHVTLIVPVSIAGNGTVIGGEGSVDPVAEIGAEGRAGLVVGIADLNSVGHSAPVVTGSASVPVRVPALGFCGAVSARTAELVMCEASVCAAVV